MEQELYLMANVEAEQSVLGSILLDRTCIDYIESLISNDFSQEAHKTIFDCILRLEKKNKPIDLITLTNELRSIGLLDDVGGISYITSLSNIIPTTSNIKHYVDIVKEFSDKRKVIKSSYNLINNLRGNIDIETSLGIFEKETQLKKHAENEGNTLSDIMSNILDSLENKSEEKVKTGVKIIDKHTNGIGKKELIAIGASSGVGKSAIALKIALQAFKQKKKVLIISREMSKEQVAERIILHNTGIEKSKYENRDFKDNDWNNIIKTMGMYSTRNIKIDDKVSTIQEIKREIRLFKPNLVVIDYVQLLTPSNSKETRERQVAELSRELKNITLDFEIPVIQLTQLAEKGIGNYRPKGESYTRESRAIYHDSNIVIYLHRVTEEKELEQAYRRVNVFKERGSFEDMKATIENYENKGIRFIEVIVDKNRTGTTGSEYYWFKGSDLNYYPIV